MQGESSEHGEEELLGGNTKMVCQRRSIFADALKAALRGQKGQ